MTITRVDLHKYVEHSCKDFGINPWDIYIGWSQFYQGKRLPISPYRNPHPWKEMGKEAATARFRTETAPGLDITGLVDVYKKYGHLRLGCWCAPDEKCHGEVLIEMVENALQNNLK